MLSVHPLHKNIAWYNNPVPDVYQIIMNKTVWNPKRGYLRYLVARRFTEQYLITEGGP
jgi:hypothetical protein